MIEIEINCIVSCKNGQSPTKEEVDEMLNNLNGYRTNTYPTMSVVTERYYWKPVIKTDHWQFAIFQELKPVEPN